MKFLLDTNAWKAISTGVRLRPLAKCLADPETKLAILDISLWEICKSVESGTLHLNVSPLEWIQAALKPNLIVLSISPEIADLSCTLKSKGLGTEDPADQLIVAAALHHRLELVTRDEKIIRWGGIAVLVY